MAHRLTEAEIQTGLASLPNWSERDGKLHREYQFSDFAHAFGFMAIAALQIEKVNHHPQWTNTYNRVIVDLTSHDAGGITNLDLRMADILERVSRRFV